MEKRLTQIEVSQIVKDPVYYNILYYKFSSLLGSMGKIQGRKSMKHVLISYKGNDRRMLNMQKRLINKALKRTVVTFYLTF